MTYATIQKIEAQANYPNLLINFSKKASLITQWFMVDELMKLVGAH